MTETQPPKDLTAQLAQWVLEQWNDRHPWRCGCMRASGGPCKWPKPAALVAYEQGQAAKAEGQHRATEVRVFNDDGSLNPAAEKIWRQAQQHAVELPNPACACQICHDLRADGAGEPVTPALAYVLTQQDHFRTTTVMVLDTLEKATWMRAALHELRKHDEPHVTYRVHAVPRVE